MAKHQTRKSVSVEAKLYVELDAFSTANDIPIAQIVAQGARAILDGRLPIDPERRKEPVLRPGRRHWRSTIDDHPTVVVGPRPPDPNVVRPVKGFCAACTGDLDTRMQYAPWGRNGAAVRICYGCQRSDARVTARNYSLGGGARVGMASGCKWTSSRGVGGER